MASGHANRANRPNTWLHRSSLRREESPCQLGAVHTWHEGDVRATFLIGLADAESFKKELREALRELGYVEGQNIAFEFRSAEGKLDRLPGLASELVRLKVDVIVALYVPCALAAKQATTEIPIVIIAAEPVETGIVASWARPGGNITGVSLMSAVFVGKCVELFRDMLAAPRKVAAITNAADPLFAK